MECNVGLTDKIVRIIIGAGIIYCIMTDIIMLSGWVEVVLIIIGAVLITTGLLSRCPLYYILGLKTCPSKPDEG